MFDKFGLTKSDQQQQIRWRVSQPFTLLIHHIWGKQYYEALFFWTYKLRAERSFLQFCKTNCTHLILRTIEARASFAQQYRIDRVIKRFHVENSIMSGLFSQTNLLLWGMQGNNGLLAKMFKNFSKSPILPAGFLLLTSVKFAVRVDKRLNNIIKNVLLLVSS